MADQSTGLLDVRSLLKDAKRSIIQILLDDPNNCGEAKSWLIGTVAHLTPRLIPSSARVDCFDLCGHTDSSATRDSTRRHSYGACTTAGSRHSDRSQQRRSSSISLQDKGGQQQQLQSSPVSSCKPAVLQLLHLLCDYRPTAVAALLSRDPSFLCSYLISSPFVTRSWFGQFSLSGIQHFKHGARAIANYALTHRTKVWQYLVWAGKHDQAPVAVAGKPHYFAELNVESTMQRLARQCPEFWSSDELLKSCESGEWIKLDTSLVVEELYRLLHEPHSTRHQPLCQLVHTFVAAADWTMLCNRLLPLLPDQQLLAFIQRLAAATHQQQQEQQKEGRLMQWVRTQAAYTKAAAAAAAVAAGQSASTSAAAIEATQLPCVDQPPPVLLCPDVQHWSFEQLLLLNALTCHRQQLLTLLRQDEDTTQQLLQLVAVAQQLFACSNTPNSTAAGLAVQQLLDIPESAKLGSTRAVQLQLQQIILAAWLLRLQLLLAAADGLDQVQAVLQQLGCSGKTMKPQTAAAAAADASNSMQQQRKQQIGPGNQAGLLEQQQQQQRQRPGEQQEHDNQVAPDGQAGLQQQQRQPLRRGTAAPPARSNSSSNDSEGRGGSSSSSSSDSHGSVHVTAQQSQHQKKRHQLCRRVKLMGSKRQRSKAVSKAGEMRKQLGKRKQRQSSSSSGGGGGKDEHHNRPRSKSSRRKACKHQRSSKHKHQRKKIRAPPQQQQQQQRVGGC